MIVYSIYCIVMWFFQGDSRAQWVYGSNAVHQPAGTAGEKLCPGAQLPSETQPEDHPPTATGTCFTTIQ